MDKEETSIGGNLFYDHIYYSKSKKYRMNEKQKIFNCFNEEQDGTIIMYFKKAGIPFVFKPIEKKG